MPNIPLKKYFSVIPRARRDLVYFQSIYDFDYNEEEEFYHQENGEPITHLLYYVTSFAKCVSEFLCQEIWGE